MNAPHFIARSQQLFSFALAALFTSAVLLSLAAQADDRHADALIAAQGSHSQQLCVAPHPAARS